MFARSATCVERADLVTRESGDMAKHRKSQSFHVIRVVDAGVKRSDEERRSQQRSDADHDRDHRDHEAAMLGPVGPMLLDDRDIHVEAGRGDPIDELVAALRDRRHPLGRTLVLAIELVDLEIDRLREALVVRAARGDQRDLLLRAFARDVGEPMLEAFAGRVPQYGLFAATYGLAALLHARHPLQVVITGAANDAHSATLEKAAHEVYRYGKSVLRVTPDRIGAATLPAALRETRRERRA